MSDAPASPPSYVLAASYRHYTAGDAIARPVCLLIPQLPGLLRSTHAALVLATKLINPSTSVIGARPGHKS